MTDIRLYKTAMCGLLTQCLAATMCLKKVLTFKLSITLSNVVTLPLKIQNAIFAYIQHLWKKCKQIAFLSPLTSLFIHIFQYFQCLK